MMGRGWHFRLLVAVGLIALCGCSSGATPSVPTAVLTPTPEPPPTSLMILHTSATQGFAESLVGRT